MTEQKHFDESELLEMLNPTFLPKIQEIARREKKAGFEDKDLKFFEFFLRFQFDEYETDLTYQKIADRMQMRLSPVTQEDIDRYLAAQQMESDDRSNEDQKDSGQAVPEGDE